MSCFDPCKKKKYILHEQKLNTRSTYSTVPSERRSENTEF